MSVAGNQRFDPGYGQPSMRASSGRSEYRCQQVMYAVVLGSMFLKSMMDTFLFQVIWSSKGHSAELRLYRTQIAESGYMEVTI